MIFKNYALTTENNDYIINLKKNDSISTDFNTEDFIEGKNDDFLYKLRISGEVDLHPSWMWEGGNTLLYRLIDDALSDETHHSQYCLNINLNNENYVRRAYYKVMCPPRITAQFAVPDCTDKNWKLSIYAKTDNLKAGDGGRVAIVIEKFLKKEDRDPRDISGTPDELIVMDIPEGSYDWKKIERIISIDENTANLLVYITCENMIGTVWLEDPLLVNLEGHNILPQFTVSNPFHENLNWFGENLSRKEWTDLDISINGNTFFNGELFQRCHRWSENEIAIPVTMVEEGHNSITIKHVSDYFGTLPYKIKKLEILYSRNKEINVISCPDIVYHKHIFSVLVSTKYDNTFVSVESDSESIVPLNESTVFAKKGLNVVKFIANGMSNDINITLTTGSYSETCKIDRVVIKDDDNVLTGTADAVYIPQDMDLTEEFIAWYTNNQIGNSITFRPVYRWSGSRELNPEVWNRIKELCNDLGLYYCNMIDGRELPGKNANPTREMLEGKYYMGNQGHERDGALYYWPSQWVVKESFFYELKYKTTYHPDYTYLSHLKYDSDSMYDGYNPNFVKDMAHGADYFIQNGLEILKGIKRHTGPTVLFKYFFEAGIEVCGAELMYGTHEILLSALRGATLAYNRKEFISHLAVQWSTTPHDTPQRYRRYQLSMFVCYLHGTNHITTEEGLYRIEEYFSDFDRFSETCKNHKKVQQDFTHFVLAHSRRGKMVNPIAVIHGKNDAWTCFGRPSAWNQLGEQWTFNTPEESWDLMNVFYPDAVLDAIYKHPCPNEPQGYYSRTPYGTVDILPIEADVSILNGYRAVSFLGWNTAEPMQIDKLIDYVKQGGILLLSWPHLFAEVDRSTAIYGDPKLIGIDKIKALLGVDFHGFKEQTKEDGTVIKVGDITLSETNKVINSLDGTPIIFENIIEKGKVIFVNHRDYPAEKNVQEIYKMLLDELGQNAVTCEAKKGWISTDDTVEFSVYDREDDIRVIYLINTNWWDNDNIPAKAELKWNGKSYNMLVERGYINILTLSKDLGVWTVDNDTDVISISNTTDGYEITLQGKGTSELRLVYNGAITADCGNLSCFSEGIYTLKIKLDGIKSIKINKN